MSRTLPLRVSLDLHRLRDIAGLIRTLAKSNLIPGRIDMVGGQLTIRKTTLPFNAHTFRISNPLALSVIETCETKYWRFLSACRAEHFSVYISARPRLYQNPFASK